MSPYAEQWLWAFAITVAVEVPIYLLFLANDLGAKRAIAVGLIAQCITHPALWWIMPRFEPYWAWLLVAEAGVLLVEALVVWVALNRAGKPNRFKLAMLTAVVANVVTTLIGVLLT